MAVAHDAATTIAVTTGNLSATHTPVGTPAGVVVLIAQNGANGTDQISGVTYGGVAMTRVRFVQEAAGEQGVAYAYFLNSGIPAGAQTVTATATGAGDQKAAVCCTVTADGGLTEVDAVASLTSTGITNPAISLPTFATDTVVYGGTMLGDTTGAVSQGASYTQIFEAAFTSPVGASANFERKTSNGTGGTVSVDWVQTNDDLAAIGIAIREPLSTTGPTIEGACKSSTDTAGTSHVVSLPYGIVSGELLMVLMDIGSTSATLNALTGWTELLDEASANGLKILYRKADGSEGSSITLTSSASTRDASMAFRISGAEDPATQAPERGTTATGTSTAPNPPSVTPTGGSKDYLWFAFFGSAGEEADDDTWSDTPPTNFTPTPPFQKTCGTAGTNLGGLLSVAYRNNTASSQDPGTFALDVSAAWRAQTIAVHPAAAAGATVPLDAASVVSSATLALTATTQVALGASSAVSSTTLALTAPTKVVLGASSAQSSATLQLSQIVPLGASSGVSSATLALTAKTAIPLGASSAVSSATLALTTQTGIPLNASSAVSSATLALTAQTYIPLGASSAVCSATLAVQSPGIAFLTLEAASGVSSATLALTAKTTVALSASSAQSSATLALTAPAKVVLGASSAVSSATLALNAPAVLVLSASSATSSATLALKAIPTFTLTASALSSASLSLTAKTTVPLDPASSTASASLSLTAKTVVPLDPASATVNATLVLLDLSGAQLHLAPVFATSSATLVVLIEGSWQQSSDQEWPEHQDSGWGEDEGEEWVQTSDADWILS